MSRPSPARSGSPDSPCSWRRAAARRPVPRPRRATTGGPRGAWGATGGDAASDASKGPKIDHLVVIVQENHTFDSYFGRYCTAPTGSAPTCTTGPACCEARARRRSRRGAVARRRSTTPPTPPTTPTTRRRCELDRDRRRQDGPLRRRRGLRRPAQLRLRRRASACSPTGSSPPAARSPIATSSRSPARARPTTCTSRARSFVFVDNDYEPDAPSAASAASRPSADGVRPTPTIGDLLDRRPACRGPGTPRATTRCSTPQRRRAAPTRPPTAPLGLSIYPCVYDPGDVPFEYYARLRRQPARTCGLSRVRRRPRRAARCRRSRSSRALGYHTEHPGYGDHDQRRRAPSCSGRASAVAGVAATRPTRSCSSPTTRAAASSITSRRRRRAPSTTQPYGTRVPLIAVGPVRAHGHRLARDAWSTRRS